MRGGGSIGEEINKQEDTESEIRCSMPRIICENRSERVRSKLARKILGYTSVPNVSC